MQLVLLTTTDCGICAEDIAKIKAKFAAEITNEEVAIYNIEDNDQANEFWVKNNLPTPPVAVLVTDDARFVTILPLDDILKE
jgi:hypothetical protein